MVKKEKVQKTAALIYMAVILLFLYLPLLWIFIFSFTSSATFGTFGSFTLEVYKELFGGKNTDKILSALTNTLLIAVFAVLFSTIIGTLGAIGIHNMKKKSRNILNTVNRIPLLDAEIITALSLMIVFLFLFGAMPRGMTGVIIAHTAFCTPYVVLNVLPKLRQMNPNTYEAALDLGASPTRALFKVILPQIRGGIAAGAIMAFTISIDDYVITSYLRQGFHTLSTYIYDTANGKKTLPPEVRALSSIMFLLVLGLLIVINSVNKDRHKPREKSQT